MSLPLPKPERKKLKREGTAESIHLDKSLLKFVEHAEKPESPGTRGGRSSRNNSPSESWDLNCGFNGAVELAKKGWAEGAKDIEKVLEHVAEILRPRDIRMDFMFDVAGARTDIGRYVAGAPDCMMRYIPPEQPTQVIKVVVNCVASAGINAKTLKARGAAIAAAVDVLESNGYRCEVIGIAAVSRRGHGGELHNVVGCVIKEAQHPLDLAQVAFALAHPAFFRRIIFGVQETLDARTREKYGYSSGRGYGMPGDFIPEETDLYFDGIMWGEEKHFSDAKACAEWTKSRLIESGLVDSSLFE